MKTRIEKKNSSNVVLSNKEFIYQHDHLGRKISFTHNGKPIVKYFYDNIGRLQNKKFSPAGTTQSSKQTGNWTDVSSWLSGILPTTNDNVTINTGQTITIPSGQIAGAGILNDRGILRNFGTLNMGKYSTTDLYNQSMSYHIRGGLKGINTDANNNLTSNLFSFRLEYENDGIYYDGNIRKQEWKSNIDNVTRSYTNAYDGSSRLKASAYASTKAGENYALNNVNYDANGNITALSRSGATNANFTIFGNVDNLNYTYPSNSNKLSKIQDLTTTNADLGDFRDGTNTDDDYDYWADGSLKRDRNKGIDSIRYNYLKLPERIKFANGRTITTEYDAEGTKLKKIVSGGETTDYEEDDIYVNGKLYQTSHDEGRIVNGVYEYNITDQNNDLRIAFKDSAGIAVPTQSIFYDNWGLSMKGMQITRNPLNFNRFQFLNRETQFETGLIDLKNRQYNPQTGRFTSQDPVIEGQEHLSLYQYGWNNPILKPDPNGDFPIAVPIIIAIAEFFSAAATTEAVVAVGAGAVAVGTTSAMSKSGGAFPGGEHQYANWAKALDPSKSNSSNSSSNSKSQSSSTSQSSKSESGKDGGTTRKEALQQGKEHAQVPRPSKGGEKTGMNELNPSSRGKNWENMKEKGAKDLGARNPNGKNQWMEHPDGHPDAGKKNVPEHHDKGHVHSTNPKGESKVIPYNNK